MIVFVVLALIFAVVLHFTPFGRGIYAIGLSSEAALFSGTKVARTKLILFILTGTIAALAGIYYTLRYGSSRGDNATGMELQVIAAVLLGGVSIFGGRGALHGVIAGVLLIGVLAQCCTGWPTSPPTSSPSSPACSARSPWCRQVFLGWVQKRRVKPGVSKERISPRSNAKSGNNHHERFRQQMNFRHKPGAVATVAALSLTLWSPRPAGVAACTAWHPVGERRGQLRCR